MFLRPSQELGLGLTASRLIGDNITDLEAGAGAGCRTVLVGTDYGPRMAELLPGRSLNLVKVVDALPDAVDL